MFVAHAVVGDVVYQGDRVDTGIDGLAIISLIDGTTLQLDTGTEIVLEELPCGEERTSDGTLFRVIRGAFRFITGTMATACPIIDTPCGCIRSSGRAAGFGSLAFGTLTIALIHELKAGSADFALLDDETITYKDLKHGVFVIVTKEATPRVIVVDDPGVSFVLRSDGVAVDVQSVVNSQAQMAQLQGVYDGVAATYARGIQDPFIQQFQQGANPSQHANAQPQSAPSSYGSSTSPNQLNISPDLLQENSGSVQLASATASIGPMSPIVSETPIATTNAQTTSSVPIPIIESSTNSTTINWVVDSSGAWNVGSDWSSNSAPLAQDSVVINLPVTVTVNESETVASLTLRGGAILDIVAGGSLLVSNGINNGGVIKLDDPTLSINGSVKLSGGGMVEMLGPTTFNLIIGVPGTSATLINVDNTITGSGIIGQGVGNLTLQNDGAGVINANVGGGQIVLDTGNVVTNAGFFEASSGGTFTIEDPIANSGTLAANGGILAVAGSVTGSGAATISGGGTLELGGTDAQTVTFVDRGTLKLDGSSDFTGIIVGLATGDVIDFVGAIVKTAHFDGSTLTVNGTPATFTISKLPLGDTFFFTNDGGTGTDFTVGTTPTISINPIEGNNIITEVQAAAGFTISGNAADGGVSINGQTMIVDIANGSGTVVDSYTGTVQSNGIWSVQVSAADARALLNGPYTVTADLSNVAVNLATEAAQTVTVNETLVTETVPVALNGSESAAIALAGIAVTDSLNPGDPTLKTVLQVSDGTITVGTPGGATVLNNGSGTVTLEGTAAAINAALASSNYTGNSGFYGTDQLAATTTDGGGNSSGTQKVAITVADTAVISETLPAPLSGSESAAIALAGIAVTDSLNPGDPTLKTVLQVSDGTITVGTPGGATVLNNGSGTVTLEGTAAAINAALASSNYTGNSGFYGTDQLAATTTDGGGNSSGTQKVAITVADTAVISETLPAPLSGSESAAIALAGIAVTDSLNPGDPTLKTVLQVSDGTITVGTPGGATVLNNGSGTVTLEGTAAAINAALASSNYTGNSGFYGTDQLAATTTDGGGNSSGTQKVAITVAGTAVISETLPAPLSGSESAAIALAGIAVTDSLNPGDPTLKTVLQVSDGTITVGTPGGATVLNNGSGTVTLEGTAAAINAALASSNYTGNSGFYGTDQLAATTTDGAGNSSGTQKVAITVADTAVISETLPALAERQRERCDRAGGHRGDRQSEPWRPDTKDRAAGQRRHHHGGDAGRRDGAQQRQRHGDAGGHGGGDQRGAGEQQLHRQQRLLRHRPAGGDDHRWRRQQLGHAEGRDHGC